jgi:hypothetical protein
MSPLIFPLLFFVEISIAHASAPASRNPIPRWPIKRNNVKKINEK